MTLDGGVCFDVAAAARICNDLIIVQTDAASLGARVSPASGRHSSHSLRVTALNLVHAAVILLIALCPQLANAASLTLAWDPPPTWSPAGYIIFAGTAPGEYTYQWDIGATNSYTFNPVPEGNTYYFAVAGYDANGIIGNLSEEISAAVPFSEPAAADALELVPSLRSPQPVGTSLTWVATARGGVPLYQYQWAFYRSGQWTVGPWTSTSRNRWIPTAPGDYLVRVRVRSAGSTAVWGEFVQSATFTVTARNTPR